MVGTSHWVKAADHALEIIHKTSGRGSVGWSLWEYHVVIETWATIYMFQGQVLINGQSKDEWERWLLITV